MQYSLNQYQDDAMSFRLDSANHFYALLNLPGEVGELCSLLAKSTRDGMKPDHTEQVRKELGDILWCLAAIAADYHFSLGDVADKNIRKLEERRKNNTIQWEGDNR